MNEKFTFNQPSKMYRFDSQNHQENDVLRVIYLNTKLQLLAYRDFKIGKTALSNHDIEGRLIKKVAEDAADLLSKNIILSLTREITPSEREMIVRVSESIDITGTTVLDTIFRHPEMKDYTSFKESPDLFRSNSHVAESSSLTYGLIRTGATLVSEFIEGRWGADGNLECNQETNYKSTIEEDVTLAYEFMSKEDLIKVVDYLEGLARSEVEIGTIIGFSKGGLVGIVEVAKGGVNAAIVDTTVVYKRVREMKADGFIFIHNHPSGELTPSKEDILIATRLKKGAEVLGITYIDSAIVGEKTFCFDVGMLKNTYCQSPKLTNLRKENPQMNRTKNINDRLHEKMRRELNDFHNRLLTLEPKQIIERSYEKATKDEIMGCLDTVELPYGQALALYKSPTPLDECYQVWLKADSNNYPELHNCVEKVATFLEKERRARSLEGGR